MANARPSRARGGRPVRRQEPAPPPPSNWLARLRRGELSQVPVAIPVLMAIIGAAAAGGMLGVDAVVDEQALPGPLQFGAENARSLLSAVAGGLLTVVVLVFWVRMVAVQMSSGLFSAQTMQTFLHDRFQQVTMGLVIGALAYMLVVLQAIPDQEAGMASVPHLSVLAGLVITAGVAVLVVESVSEGARSSETGKLLRRIGDQVVAQVRTTHPEAGQGYGPHSAGDMSPQPPSWPHHVVTAGVSGWVTRLDEDALLVALPPRATAQLELRVGLFMTEGTPLCRVWTGDQHRDQPPEPGAQLPADLDDRVRAALTVGDGPTVEQDIGFGLRLLTDVAERALAPASGDTSAAEQAIVRLGVVLREVLVRDLPPPTRQDDEGRTLLRPHELAPAEYVHKAFDRVRQTGAASPNVAIALLSTLDMLRFELTAAGREPWIEPLHQQAHLIVESVERQSGLSRSDIERVRHLAERQDLVAARDRHVVSEYLP